MSFIVLCLFSIILIGCGKKGYRSIKVFNANGNVDVVRNKKTIDATKDMKLKNNDKVIVDAQSNAVLKLDNDKYVMVKENTTLTLIATGKSETSKTRIVVDKGGVVVEVKEKLNEKESFEIASSNSVMAIRGTQISFEVEVKDNKITTSVAVLEGTTEILLYKNEKLSSTTLNKDFKLSYTTNLNEVAKDISKVIKKGKVEEINDTVLETVFNVVKEELTSEEIDDIVDTINTFERDDDLVNGVIKFKFTNNPFAGDNPYDYIEIEENYRDLVGLKYTYSQTIDGEYKEFDSNNPLAIGDWYCKITAGNAYRSEPLKFSVIIEEMTLSVDSNVSYSTDPTEFIKTSSKKTNLKYEYSDAEDGEYTEFNPDDPLDLGTWYCRVVSTTSYTSNIIVITIVEKELDIKFELSQYVIGNTGYIRTTFSDLEEFFTSDIATTPNDGTIPYCPSDYQYYVEFGVSYTDGSDGGYTYCLDYSNRDVINYTGFSGESAMNIYYSISLPYGYKSVLNGTNDIFEFHNELTVNEMYIEQNNDNYKLYAFVDAYSTYFDNDLKILYTYDDNNSEYGTLSFSNDQYHCYTDEIPTTAGVKSFKFVLLNPDSDEIVLESKTYSFDATIFNESIEGNASMNASYNGITTYNEDGTINIYQDMGFIKETENDFVFLAKYQYKRSKIDNKIYTADHSDEYMFEFVSGNVRFASCEDLPNERFACTYARIAKYDSEIYYIPLQPLMESNATFNGTYEEVSYGAVGGTESSLIIYSNGYFVRGNEYTVYDNNGNIIGTVTEEDFTSNTEFVKTINGITPSDVYISGNAYGYISQEYLGGEDMIGAFSDLEPVKTLLANAGITIKGSNIRPLDHMCIRMG